MSMHLSAKSLLVCAVALLATVPPVALAAGTAEAGKAKSTVCAACHGQNGNSANPEWPNLAGQHAAYIIAQLQYFKSGQRQNALMSSQAMGLSEQDMKDLAAYYSSQTLKVPGAVEGTVETGERLYQGGRASSNLSACIGCHGPRGRGNPGAKIPAIGGQHAAYTANTLKAYRSGERQNQMMNAIAGYLTDADIEALSGYLQGLY